MIKTASLALATCLLAASCAVAQSTDPNATPNSNSGTAGAAQTQTTDTTTKTKKHHHHHHHQKSTTSTTTTDQSGTTGNKPAQGTNPQPTQPNPPNM